MSSAKPLSLHKGIAFLVCSLMLLSCAKREDTVNIRHAIASLTVGRVYMLKQGKTSWRPLSVGRKLHHQDIVKTSTESRAVLSIPGSCEMHVGENSLVAVELENMPNGGRMSAINVKRGKILVNVKKIVGSKDAFLVRTPTAVAAIRGTSFKTEVDSKTGKSAVYVLKGKVAVKKRRYRKPEKGKLVVDPNPSFL